MMDSVIKRKKYLMRRKISILNIQDKAWFYIIPTFLFLSILYIYPIIQSIYKSTLNKNDIWNNFSNYLNLFSDSFFWNSLKNTLIFSVISVLAHMLIGIFLALLLNLKLNPVVMNFFKGILVIPWLITTVAAGAIWKLIYHPVGILNYILMHLNIVKSAVDWLGDPRIALFSIAIVNVWKFYPIFYIVILAGLKTIPEDLYESARIDGAKHYQSFIHITLPHLRGIIIFMSLIDFISTLRHFDFVYLLTRGGPMRATELISNYIFNLAFQSNLFNYGATIAIFMVAVSLIFSSLYLRLNKEMG